MQDKPTTNRREFLKRSGIAAGATAAGLSLARSAHAQGKQEIRIGMIGSGSRCSGAAAQSLKADQGVKLVAMCDVFQARIDGSYNSLKSLCDSPDNTVKPDQFAVDADHTWTDFDGYKKVIDSCDAVLIACASKFHPMYMEAAIKAGKHVFVEKPHAIDPVGIRRVEAACELAKEKGLCVMSGLQSRWDPGWQELMARIHDGQIGDIVAMQSMFLRAPYRVYSREPGLSETEYHFSNWYHFCWLSGDDVTQSLVHNVDRMSWAMQGEMPKWAFAVAGRSGSFGEVYGDMYDHSCVIYEYESGPRLYALCRTTSGCYNNGGDYIMGTKGEANLGRREIKGENPWKYDSRGKRTGSAYDIEQAELVKHIKAGTTVNCGDYMAKSTMVGIMGQIASYQGTSVTWDQCYNSDLQFGPAPDGVSFETPPPTLPDETGNYPLPIPGMTKLV